jgi:hypothetical protein
VIVTPPTLAIGSLKFFADFLTVRLGALAEAAVLGDVAPDAATLCALPPHPAASEQVAASPTKFQSRLLRTQPTLVSREERCAAVSYAPRHTRAQPGPAVAQPALSDAATACEIRACRRRF